MTVCARQGEADVYCKCFVRGIVEVGGPGYSERSAVCASVGVRWQQTISGAESRVVGGTVDVMTVRTP